MTFDPCTLAPTGRAIFDGVADEFDLSEHEKALLISTAQTADAIAALQATVDADGHVVNGKPHPLLVEMRQQRVTFSRLVASLRVPDDDGAAPQRRGGARGVYAVGSA